MISFKKEGIHIIRILVVEDDLFDLIVSDIMMPEIDGFEFAETVRSLNKTIPILFMTEKKLAVGNLTMDADAVTAVRDGEEIPVTVREFNILYKLLSYQNKTFARAAHGSVLEYGE